MKLRRESARAVPAAANGLANVDFLLSLIFKANRTGGKEQNRVCYVCGSSSQVRHSSGQHDYLLCDLIASDSSIRGQSVADTVRASYRKALWFVAYIGGTTMRPGVRKRSSISSDLGRGAKVEQW